MSFKRIFKWRCDTEACDGEDEVQEYGGPEGWRWYQLQGKPVRHACKNCAIRMAVSGWNTHPGDQNQLVPPPTTAPTP